jgi:2-succinyl-5-enolpyruvyl-6-hydroxy-3-cyclohexene-1-carboxylate synthase
MTRDATTAFARALVDEWARAGVNDACVAPGSRSAPLALALAADDRFRVHVHLDERSAGFFALGTAKASGTPAVVVCTSGTAAANFHPAVLEAHHARTPLLVCTADRPPELRDTGAGQTVDQIALYRGAVRWFCEVGVPEDRPQAARSWRSVAARAVAEALGPPAGPVHLNLAFREPLVPTGAPLVDAPGRPDGRPWTTVTRAQRVPNAATVARLAASVREHRRGLVVAGWGSGTSPDAVDAFASAAGWPVLADPISCLRAGRHDVSTYEALLRAPGFADRHRPEIVLRLGAAPTSKTLTSWLDDDVPQALVDPDGAWLDPGRGASERLAVDAEPLLTAVTDALAAVAPGPVGAEEGAGATRSAPTAERRAGRDAPSRWLRSWLEAERVARAALDDLLDGWEPLFEGRVARDVVDVVPDGSTLVVASSMPVRDVEAFARPRSGVRFLANRGVNGIDGFVSTALGAAARSSGPVVALLGDLCLLHDANGLLGAADRGIDLTFVVLDNDGGGIFSFLPQAALPEHFELLFGTPHGIDLATLATAHGLAAERVEKAGDLAPTLRRVLAAGGVRLVIVPTDRADNVARHREAWAAVAAALDG